MNKKIIEEIRRDHEEQVYNLECRGHDIEVFCLSKRLPSKRLQRTRIGYHIHSPVS